ncbi:MAG: hypothetical protein BWY69_01688 [Planctomycetes bacterium ADurb.Bin401]|nr:MAG: hypothetical protein BWY69_01688 [Planctomycetes bacterium ADurb.Bin401]
MMATAFVYPAATVFIMSSVARTEVAKFCSCAGACNIFVQSSLMFTSGWLITHIFNGNYGFAFIMAVIFVSIGVPFFYFIPKWSKRMENKLENSKNELPVQDQAVVEGNDICK